MNFFQRLLNLFKRVKEPQQNQTLPPPVPIQPLPPKPEPQLVPTPPTPIQSTPTVEKAPTPFEVWEQDKFGSPATDPREQERRQNLFKWEQDFQAQVYNGPISVDDLTDAEKAYLLYCAEQKNCAGVHFKVLSGTVTQINRVINYADVIRQEQHPETYTGRLVAIVQGFYPDAKL